MTFLDLIGILTILKHINIKWPFKMQEIKHMEAAKGKLCNVTNNKDISQKNDYHIFNW